MLAAATFTICGDPQYAHFPDICAGPSVTVAPQLSHFSATPWGKAHACPASV
jgi:hypothetical protein